MDRELILTHREDPKELEDRRKEIEGKLFGMSQITISNFRMFFSWIGLMYICVSNPWPFQQNVLVFSLLLQLFIHGLRKSCFKKRFEVDRIHLLPDKYIYNTLIGLKFMISYYFVGKFKQILSFIIPGETQVDYDIMGDVLIFVFLFVHLHDLINLNKLIGYKIGRAKYAFDMRQRGYSIPAIPHTNPVVLNCPPRDRRPQPIVREEFHQVLRDAQVIRMNRDGFRQRVAPAG